MPKVAGRLKFDSEVAAAHEARIAPNRQTVKVFDVPVVVDETKCITGCHVCVESCPVDCLAIDLNKGKSHMKFDDCWYCLACEVDCPTNAITVKMPFLLR
ncbi:MAG TPA: ferredoxin family protein [Chthoniobacteraceae bacterium]|jgi:NAD-dependent dihydropyrimidine dehydrogenase PreA subunit